MSPLSVRVIFEQLKRAKNMNIKDCFELDFNLGIR